MQLKFDYIELIVYGRAMPPRFLGRRSMEFIVSPKKVVGCRGGSQNVGGGILLLENRKVCRRFPDLKIEKLPNVHFVSFDRYEIHIQYLEYV